MRVLVFFFFLSLLNFIISNVIYNLWFCINIQNSYQPQFLCIRQESHRSGKTICINVSALTTTKMLPGLINQASSHLDYSWDLTGTWVLSPNWELTFLWKISKKKILSCIFYKTASIKTNAITPCIYSNQQKSRVVTAECCLCCNVNIHWQEKKLHHNNPQL